MMACKIDGSGTVLILSHPVTPIVEAGKNQVARNTILVRTIVSAM